MPQNPMEISQRRPVHMAGLYILICLNSPNTLSRQQTKGPDRPAIRPSCPSRPLGLCLSIYLFIFKLCSSPALLLNFRIPFLSSCCIRVTIGLSPLIRLDIFPQAPSPTVIPSVQIFDFAPSTSHPLRHLTSTSVLPCCFSPPNAHYPRTSSLSFEPCRTLTACYRYNRQKLTPKRCFLSLLGLSRVVGVR